MRLKNIFTVEWLPPPPVFVGLLQFAGGVSDTIITKFAQGSRKFRQELGRAVQVQSKIDPDADIFRDVVEAAMELMEPEILDEPVGDTPDAALGAVE